MGFYGSRIPSFAERIPLASAIVYKEGEYAVAKVWNEQWGRWSRIAKSTDHASVIQALDGVFNILNIIVNSDIVTNKPIRFTTSEYVNINFLGHKIISNAGGMYAPTLSYQVPNGTFIVKNVIIDNQESVGDGITAGATDIYPKKVIIENVDVRNFTNHAFYFIMSDPTTSSDENTQHDIILKNIKAEACSSGSSNECLTVDNARKVIINNAEFIGNKIAYIVSSEVYINKLRYYTSDWGLSIRSRKSVCSEITADGTGSHAHLTIEPYVSVELVYQFDSCYIAVIQNFRGIGNSCRIMLRPYDDTYTIKHAVINNITQKQTPIHIEPSTDYGTVETLEIRNVKFIEYSFKYHILNIKNTSIKRLLIDGVELPGINATYTRAIYIENDKANREINAVIKSITRGIPYVGQSNDKGAGYGITGEIDIDPTLYNNFWQLTSGTSQPKLIRNSGTATITAGSTRVTVNHGLVSTPDKVHVTPLSDPGDRYWVENRTSTTFDIVLASPPSSDVIFSWYAEV